MFAFDKNKLSTAAHGEPSPERGSDITSSARRRWKIAIALLALVGVGAWSNGSIDPRAIAAVLKDPLSLFAARSPGERAPGALTQTKPARGSAPQVRRTVPQERVLSGVRSRPAGVAEPFGGDAPAGFVDPGAPAGDGIAIGDPGSGDPVFADGGGGGGAPFFVPPTSIGPGVGTIGGGGGGPGGSGGDPGGTVDTPTSPVPEPATWLTMMIGLFTIGAALRRRRTATASGAGDDGEQAGEEAGVLADR